MKVKKVLFIILGCVGLALGLLLCAQFGKAA